MKIDEQEIGILLSSPPKFEAFLNEVRKRLEEHRLQRLQNHWRMAIPRLEIERLHAQEEEDDELNADLEHLTAAFQAALAKLSLPKLSISLPAKSPVNDEHTASQTGVRNDTSAPDQATNAAGGKSTTGISRGDASSDAPVSFESERREKLTRRRAAVGGVLEWRKSLGAQGVTETNFEDERELLCLLLDDCLKAGVSPSSTKVRAALIEAAPKLLEGLPKYEKFLSAVHAERQRKSGETLKTPHPQETSPMDDFELVRQSAARLTHGKRVMMIGGKRRPQVQYKLSKMLECEVIWTDSEANDQAAKFNALIKKVDMVLMLKNFARHQLFYNSRDIMKQQGGHFVVLPSGYGVRQVINQINTYVERGKQEEVPWNGLPSDDDY